MRLSLRSNPPLFHPHSTIYFLPLQPCSSSPPIISQSHCSQHSSLSHCSFSYMCTLWSLPFSLVLLISTSGATDHYFDYRLISFKLLINWCGKLKGDGQNILEWWCCVACFYLSFLPPGKNEKSINIFLPQAKLLQLEDRMSSFWTYFMKMMSKFTQKYTQHSASA